MKNLRQFIYESIDEDNNTFWLLDKWFEHNEQHFNDFMNLMAIFGNRKTIDIKELSECIKNTDLYEHLYEFINFIDNDLDPIAEKDYIYSLKKILEYVINNKSKKNKFT